MKQFDRIVELSPYPVKMKCSYTAMFRWGEQGDTQPYQRIDFRPHIEISSTIKNKLQRTAYLLHEMGHAKHYKRYCKCYIQSRASDEGINFLAEYHAERFALRFMLRHKLKRVLRFEINDLKHNRHTFGLVWDKVITQLQQEKIWTKCERYLAE